MKFHTVRDLRTQPAQVWENLKNAGPVIVTNNGKPTAIMLPITEDSFEETLAAVVQARGLRAMARAQDISAANGNDTMSLAEINDEIAAARKEAQLA